jgi:hypothetical protein
MVPAISGEATVKASFAFSQASSKRLNFPASVWYGLFLRRIEAVRLG